MLWILLLACDRGVADLNAPGCGSDPCPVCEMDADCVVLHNPCFETAMCVDVDDNWAVPMPGCPDRNQYETPPAEACICQAGACEVGP